MDILLSPDTLSIVGNINHIIISSVKDVSFTLKDHASGSIVIQHTYTPSRTGRIEVDVRDIIRPLLSFSLRNVSDPYRQPAIVKTFDVTVLELDANGEPAGDTQTKTFTVIRAGVDSLAETPDNFLQHNFLTWQPNVKPVTYYSPEFLTYYAIDATVIKCKAHLDSSDKDLILAHIAVGECWTVPVQYAIIAGKTNALPLYYDIWAENGAGERLTYIQRYYADDMRSENEEWILFENSLGGIDTFRAYGVGQTTSEHTHNIAEIEEVAEEYRVDTTRKFKKNTGHLDRKERLWLLDFFPSLNKYIYTASHIRRIVVTESDVNYLVRELPSNYNFTFKYADAQPYLNLPRTDKPLEVLNIKVPDVGSFTIAPRLVEFPALTLSEGALFPIQDPYAESWGTTTAGAIVGFMTKLLISSYKGDGAIGHTHSNINLLEALSVSGRYLLYKAQKIYAEYADKAKYAQEFDPKSPMWNKFLRKDKADSTNFPISFLGDVKIGEKYYINADGSARLDTLKTRNLEVTGQMKIFELIVDRARSVGGSLILTPADGFTVDKVVALDSAGNPVTGVMQVAAYRLYWKATDGNGKARENMWEVKDQALCQSHNRAIGAGTHYNVSNKLYWCAVVGMNGADASGFPQPVKEEIEGEIFECNYIDISVSNKLEGCTVNPEVGDDIVMLGHQGNKTERQNAEYISVYSSLDPGLRPALHAFYRGIKTFELEKYRKTYTDASGTHVVGTLDVETGSGTKSLDRYIEENSAAGKDSIMWKIIPSISAIQNKSGKISFKVQKIQNGNVTIFNEQSVLNVEKCGLWVYDGTDDYTVLGKSVHIGSEYSLADLYQSGKYLNIILMRGIDRKILTTLTLHKIGSPSLPNSYNIVTSKQAIDNIGDLLIVTVKKNDSLITNQAALQAEKLSLYAYDGQDDFANPGRMVECGTATRISSIFKSGKYLNLVLIQNTGWKVLAVKTLLPAGEKGDTVYQYWLDPPTLTVSANETGAVATKGASTKLYVKHADATAAHIKSIQFFTSSVYNAAGDCSIVYDFTTYHQGECEIRITSMQTLYDRDVDLHYPVPSANVRLEIEMQDGKKLNTTLTVNVDYSKTAVRFKVLEDSVKSTVSSLNKTQKSVSKIEQKSDEIDLRVKSFGLGRNLLRDTEFTELKNTTGGVELCKDQSKKHGEAGCLLIDQTGHSSFTGFGLRYKVRVEPTKTYIGSVWVMTEDVTTIDKGLFIEYMSNRDGKGSYRDHIATHRMELSINGIWQRFEFVVTAPAGCIQMEVNIYLAQNGVLYLSEPQFEQQIKARDKASPWSPYAGLLEAGINLKDGTILLKSQRVLFYNTETKKYELALTPDGKLKGSFIEAGGLSAKQIAQPFESYASIQEFRAGKSQSWIVNKDMGDVALLFNKSLNGVTIHIFNNTKSSIKFLIPLVHDLHGITGGVSSVIIPSYRKFSGTWIYDKQSDRASVYAECPISINKIDSSVRVKAPDGSEV